jgi:hypothetical protein
MICPTWETVHMCCSYGSVSVSLRQPARDRSYCGSRSGNGSWTDGGGTAGTTAARCDPRPREGVVIEQGDPDCGGILLGLLLTGLRIQLARIP